MFDIRLCIFIKINNVQLMMHYTLSLPLSLSLPLLDPAATLDLGGFPHMELVYTIQYTAS